MKKIISTVIPFVLMFSLAACELSPTQIVSPSTQTSTLNRCERTKQEGIWLDETNPISILGLIDNEGVYSIFLHHHKQ